jgi:hypothetical protein
VAVLLGCLFWNYLETVVEAVSAHCAVRRSLNPVSSQLYPTPIPPHQLLSFFYYFIAYCHFLRLKLFHFQRPKKKNERPRRRRPRRAKLRQLRSRRSARKKPRRPPRPRNVPKRHGSLPRRNGSLPRRRRKLPRRYHTLERSMPVRPNPLTLTLMMRCCSSPLGFRRTTNLSLLHLALAKNIFSVVFLLCPPSSSPLSSHPPFPLYAPQPTILTRVREGNESERGFKGTFECGIS